MPDLLPAAELVCKSVRHAGRSARAVFGAVGAVADALFDMALPEMFSEQEAADYLKASAVNPPAAVDDPAGDSSPLTPAGSPVHDAWPVLAICDVLAKHPYWPANHSSIGTNGHCGCGDRPHGLMEWREHVAPLIADRLVGAAAAELMRNAAFQSGPSN